MVITKNNGDNAFVRRVDAESRVTVWAVNRANTPQISKLGLTHVPGGAVDTSGMKMLHTTGPGVNMKLHDSSMQPGQFGQYLQPAGQFGLQPQSQYFPATRPSAIPQFYSVSPQNLASAIRDLTGMFDLVSFAEKQNLFPRDMDKVTGPKLCRCFCDLTHLADGFNFDCYNADGSFKARFVLQNFSVFEVKWFKYTDSPEKGCFLFRPSISTVYVPPNCDGTFTTNANLATLHFKNMGWICLAGGIEKLDWEIIRRFGKDSRLVWSIFQEDPLLEKNDFAETFSLVTEAKRRGIRMNILRAEATEKIFGDSWDAKENLLDDREIKLVAQRYHLPIDPVWNDLPGEINFERAWFPLRSPFWNGNHVAVFFGKKSIDFLQKFIEQGLKTLSTSAKALVVFDDKDKPMAKRFSATGGRNVRFATSCVFNDKETFLEKVPEIADLVFIVVPDEKNLDLQDMLELCERAELPVGIFSRSEDAPQEGSASETVYRVAKSQSAENLFSIKNMGKNIIVNYEFSSFGMKETPGTEEDMRKGE